MTLIQFAFIVLIKFFFIPRYLRRAVLVTKIFLSTTWRKLQFQKSSAMDGMQQDDEGPNEPGVINEDLIFEMIAMDHANPINDVQVDTDSDVEIESDNSDTDQEMISYSSAEEEDDDEEEEQHQQQNHHQQVDHNSDDSDTSIDEPRFSRRIQHRLVYTARKYPPRGVSMYAFQPFRLIKVDYKYRNVLNDYPLSRSGHRVIADESNLYCLGGYNPQCAIYAARLGSCLLFQEVWRYNFGTNRWKLILDGAKERTMPSELASNALAIHKNVLISHGGTGYPFGESCSNACHIYTTNDKAIVTKLNTTGDPPIAQYGPGIIIHNNYLYTIGGTTGFDYSCDVYRLNLQTKVWESVYICRPEMREDPQGRYRHEVVYDGKYIYLLGGGTSNSVFDLHILPAFNLETNSWEYIETLPDQSVISLSTTNTRDIGYPKPRKCFSCVQHTNTNGDVEAFITGGLQSEFTFYFSDIWRLNLTTKQWTVITKAVLPKALYFHSAAHSGNGCMYIFGGIEYTEKESRRRNNLFKMWMTIPKLSEICWEAITHYNENIYLQGPEKLHRAGIPNRFVQRLSFNFKEEEERKLLCLALGNNAETV